MWRLLRFARAPSYRPVLSLVTSSSSGAEMAAFPSSRGSAAPEQQQPRLSPEEFRLWKEARDERAKRVSPGTAALCSSKYLYGAFNASSVISHHHKRTGTFPPSTVLQVTFGQQLSSSPHPIFFWLLPQEEQQRQAQRTADIQAGAVPIEELTGDLPCLSTVYTAPELQHQCKTGHVCL